MSIAKPGETITYANQPNNVAAYRLGLAAAHARPGGDCIDHGLSLLQELQLRGFGVVALNSSQPDGTHCDAAVTIAADPSANKREAGES